MTLRRALVGLLLSGFIAGIAWARPGVVRTTDGRTFEGEITDKGNDGVMVATKGGTITLNRADVQHIDYAADIKEAYQKRLASLPPNASANDHFEIARWLYDSKAYDLARQELGTVLTLDPNNAQASLLRQTIDRQMAWQASGRTGQNTQPKPEEQHTGPATVRDHKYVTPEEINEIRLSEMRPDERGLRIRLDGNVRKRFVEFTNMDPREFAAMSEFQKGLAVLRQGTAAMRKDVKVINDPAALAAFKSRIQPLVLQGCATSNCHGGVNAGSFQLFSPASNDAATYSNFLIIMRRVVKIGSTDYRLVDRIYPTNSLLTQFGLPLDKADLDHPKVQGWNPVFRGLDDPRYELVMTWIRNVLIAVPPDYHDPQKFPYVDPGSSAPTTRPAVPPPAPQAQQPQPPQPPQPQPQPQNQRPNQTQQNRNQGNGSGTGNDATNKLDELRGRLRPVGL